MGPTTWLLGGLKEPIHVKHLEQCSAHSSLSRKDDDNGDGDGGDDSLF